jgi:translation initiation factor 6 (eIF-6)
MSNKLTESLVTGQALVGNSAVTTSTGVLLNGTVGSQLIIYATDPVFAVVSSGTANVSFIDAC